MCWCIFVPLSTWYYTLVIHVACCTYSATYSRTCTHSHTHTYTYTHSNIRTYNHSHTRTHKHSYTITHNDTHAYNNYSKALFTLKTLTLDAAFFHRFSIAFDSIFSSVHTQKPFLLSFFILNSIVCQKL